MAKPLQIQIVERARSLIADERHWCRGQLAEDASGVSVFPAASSAVKRCGLGAVITAAYQLTLTTILQTNLPTTHCDHNTESPHWCM
jgi:hypothetical protein